MNNLIISAADGHFMLQSSKKKTLLFIYYSRLFCSADILKSKAWKFSLNRRNSRDASQKKHADLVWQLYIWGGCDFALMLRLPTWLMWPRSVLAGHRAAGHRGQSSKVGKWLRLCGCDWLKPRQPTSGDFTQALIARWKSRSTTEMIKRVWKNNGDKTTMKPRRRQTCAATEWNGDE